MISNSFSVESMEYPLRKWFSGSKSLPEPSFNEFVFQTVANRVYRSRIVFGGPAGVEFNFLSQLGSKIKK